MNKRPSFPFYLVAMVFVLVLLCFLGLTKITITSKITIDALVGVVLLASICGLSVYFSYIPGLIAGLVWGICLQSINHSSVSFIMCFSVVLMLLWSYDFLVWINPKSPFNVYLSSLVGVGAYFLLQVFLFQLPLNAAIISSAVALIMVKALTNKLRALHLINHEDKELVQKFEKDLLSFLYSRINQKYNTNFQRPIKPEKKGIDFKC